MRYFYLTFQHTSVRSIRFRAARFYVVQLGKYFAYQQVLPNQDNAFFTDTTDQDMYLGNTLRSINIAEDETSFLGKMLNSHGYEAFNVQMTEMTPHQRAWFTGRHGYYYFDSMLQQLFMNNNSGRRFDTAIESVRNTRSVRLLKRSRHGGGLMRYKGSEFTRPVDFMRAKQMFTELAALVRETLADAHTTRIDEFFVDRGAEAHGVGLYKTFERIKEALDDNHNLDLDIVRCDCGHFEYSDDTHSVRDDTWCESCFNDDAVYVEDRDEYWSRDDAYWSDRHDAYYSYDRDNDDDESQDPDSLLEYSTNVLDFISPDTSIKSSPHGEFLMGIEFEMETTGRISAAVDDVRSQLGSGYCVCKYDGSLGGGGLEIVTAPRGLTEHISKFKAWTVDSAYRAWDRKCCGMHIHIDSRAFTQMTLGKFIMFINDRNNMEFIRKIAGRHPERDDQARSYAAAEHQDILCNPSKAVKGKSYERYRMVNLQNLTRKESQRLGFGDRFDEGNYNTVEVRIFRASLKKERLLAQIEFTHAAVMFCRVASWRELNQTTFLKWLKGSAAGLYPHLSDWYGVRRRVPVCNAGKQAVCEDQPEATTEGD